MKILKPAFLLALAAVALSGCGKKSAVRYEYTAVSRGSVQNSISAVGTLEATQTVVVQSPVSGIVDSLLVRSGDSVTVGQKICEMNTTGNPTARQISPVYSPIDGIVAAVSVSEGTSVLGRGSPAATTLFTLTSRTDTLVISAPVGELDIAKIAAGTEERLTFQAAQGRAYTSKVSRIVPLATTTDNVVTYTVQSEIANKDGTLRPGMTAAIQFILEKESDVLTVPNAALRFSPASEEEKEAAKPAANAVTSALTGGKAGSSGGNPFGHPTGGQSFYSGEKDGSEKPQATEKKNEKTLWYEDESGKLQSVAVYAGISDGIKTVVSAVDEGVSLEALKVILREVGE